MDGFLLIDKPAGMTSHDVVDRLRRVTGERRIGHAGTLDPFATGLLILGIGKATKKLGDLVGLDKSYEATLVLGATSDTFDKEGIITPLLAKERGRGEVPPDRSDIDRVLDKFRGEYDQLTPLFSAKKLHGKKLYELARAGTATEEMRPVKRVKISKLEAGEYAWPKLRLTIDCSSGTYIRSLADDIGRELGVGAYVDALRRTSIGPFTVKDALPLPDLTPEVIHKHLLPTNASAPNPAP